MSCDLVFRLTGPTRELFNPTAIPIARVEIHLRIDPGWIQPKQPLHAAELLEDSSPIQQGELSQTGKRIPDRYLILRLAVLL
ncbi:MAG TPA: hypothetical protein VJ553_04295, partial [Candidatus Paceibacterota bacterium]|nr:hypothetical protein [Candidatus Paceibacterota bacterium]